MMLDHLHKNSSILYRDDSFQVIVKFPHKHMCMGIIGKGKLSQQNYFWGKG